MAPDHFHELPGSLLLAADVLRTADPFSLRENVSGETRCISVPVRACLEKAFCKMCVTVCGRFRPDEGAVAGYGNRIRVKSPAKWGVQIAGMIFQTRSSSFHINLKDFKRHCRI
ncbi:MAG: DUF6783 domain-containing protein [Ruminococcus sp.]